MKFSSSLCLAFLSVGLFSQTMAQEHPLSLMDKEANLQKTLSYSIYLKINESNVNRATLMASVLEKLRQAQLPIVFSFSDQPKFADIIVEIKNDKEVMIDGSVIKIDNLQNLAQVITSWVIREYGQGIIPHAVPVFEDVKDGYVSFRIPSVITLPNKKILAFIEARAEYKDTACNDIVMKTSSDGGKTWSAPQVVSADGDFSLNNITVGYIEEKNEIVLMYQSYPPKTSEGSNFGTGANRLKVYVTRSLNEGKTWTQPEEITAQIFHPKANVVCCGPGVMIREEKGDHPGRLIVPFNALSGNTWYNYLVYSDDQGKTWKRAEGESQYGTNESQVVQTGDNQFVICARSHRNMGCHSATTPAGWSPWRFSKITRNRAYIPVEFKEGKVLWSPTEVREDLPDPNCQGSITRLGKYGDGKKSRLILSNPASQYTLKDDRGRSFEQIPPGRVNGTVRISYDDGKTWKYSKRFFGDQFTHFGYSVLTDMGDGKIGCLFESGPKVMFTTFDLEWLSAGEDKNK